MDDYISREAALKFRLTANLRPEKLTAVQAVADAIAAYIKSIPPAAVRPVVPAKWIALDIYRGMGNYKCSACNQECYVPECMGEPMYIYCPNCGVKMGKSPRE